VQYEAWVMRFFERHLLAGFGKITTAAVGPTTADSSGRAVAEPAS
jgi:hypothetical protein